MTTETDRKQARSRFNRTVKMFVCLFLLSLILFFVGGNILWKIDMRNTAVVLRQSDCADHLHRLGHELLEYGLAHPEAVTPDRMVPDVIRAALRDGELDEKHLCCVRDWRSYLVFPAPASVLRLEKEPEHVPIVMDRPDAHEEGAFVTTAYRLIRGKDPANVRVLYSDGTLEVVSREEAERLVSALSPRPIEIVPETQNEVEP